jgi:hypothetical protein
VESGRWGENHYYPVLQEGTMDGQCNPHSPFESFLIGDLDPCFIHLAGAVLNVHSHREGFTCREVGTLRNVYSHMAYVPVDHREGTNKLECE